MKLKILICATIAACLLGCMGTKSITETIKGTLCSCTTTQVTVLEEDKLHYDIIQLTATTIVNPPVTPPL
jgi:hypothetical protein